MSSLRFPFPTPGIPLSQHPGVSRSLPFTEKKSKFVFYNTINKMGSSASVEMSQDAKYRAFIALKERYEHEKQVHAGGDRLSDAQLLAQYRVRFFEIANSAEYNQELSESEKNAQQKALHARLSSDDQLLSNRGFCVGDVVKIMDEGFWIEGVIVAIKDQNNILVDFGTSILDSLDIPLPEAVLENAPATEDEQEDEDKFGLALTPQEAASKKVVTAKDCILVMSGEALEVGDKVEVCSPGSFLYCMGYIWMIHRKYEPETHKIHVTYDVYMETTEHGESIGTRSQETMEEKINTYTAMLRNKQEPPMEWDIEYGVEPENIRKILSGRIRSHDRWKSAWRKVTAFLAFKQGAHGHGDHAH